MQKPSEAVDATLRRRQSDYIPLHDNVWGDTARKWVKQGMPADEKGNPVNAVDHFKFDMTAWGGFGDWQAHRGEQEVLEETDEWIVRRNGNGAALKYWKHKSGTPEHIDFLMTSREVWERDYRPHLVGTAKERCPDPGERAESVATIRKKGLWAGFGDLCNWEKLRASLGDLTMYMSLVDDPEWIKDFNRVYTDLQKESFKILWDGGARPDGVWIYEDLGYKNALFCNPDILRELIFPYYAELIDLFHSYDLTVVLHSCGYQEPMIPLAIEAGFDGLNPMEAKAGNDILKYADMYGDQIAFVGGLDALVLESGDRELIKKSVTDLIQGMRERGASFVYGSDHSLSTNIDYEDFCYSLEVYQELKWN